MITIYNDIELERLKIQTQLDATKAQLERNKLGQFSTPTILATQVLEYAQSLIQPDVKLRFLDPAIGTGSFFSALLRTFSSKQIDKAMVMKWIPYMVMQLTNCGVHLLSNCTSLISHVLCHQVQMIPDIICNPPYVRHHHILKDEKQRLQKLGEQITGIKLSQQVGLYCHFLYLSHSWMAKNGVAGWLIPSEFMDVNYGKEIKEYLLRNVTLLRIHRFKSEDVQFADALVSSAVVWFINKTPDPNYNVEFTYGGTLSKPQDSALISTNILRDATKWTKFPSMMYKSTSSHEYALQRHPLVAEDIKEETSSVTAVYTKLKYDTNANGQNKLLLSDVFEIKRGLATGTNSFFVLNKKQIAKYQIPSKFLTPVLPSSRYLSSNKVEADENGDPVLEQPLFLLTCSIPEEEVRANHHSLWEYLQVGVELGIHKNYLCSHRKPWYSQENRPASLFVCSYMGRQDHKQEKPFRFILNHSKATVTNAYHILYPNANLQQELQYNSQLANLLWIALNSIAQETLISEGRVYGGGLYKMEPRELGNVVADNLFSLVQHYLPVAQRTLL